MQTTTPHLFPPPHNHLSSLDLRSGWRRREIEKALAKHTSDQCTCRVNALLPGRLHLKGTENAEQVVRVTASPEAAGLDPVFACGFQSQKIQGQLADQGEVLGTMPHSGPVVIFAKRPIQYPVHLILNAPVTVHRVSQRRERPLVPAARG